MAPRTNDKNVKSFTENQVESWWDNHNLLAFSMK